MVDHHDAGTAQPFGLMHKQIAALVVHVICDDESLWEHKIVVWGDMQHKQAPEIHDLQPGM